MLNHSPFDTHLAVCIDRFDASFNGVGSIAWSDFLLNPRRLRGSDFLMRWSQGVWSEDRFKMAINATEMYFALPYGPSGTAPNNDVRAFELYFERLEAAGLATLKRPDLLVFRKDHLAFVEHFLEQIGGVQELPFIPETDLKPLLAHAQIAIECENSLWVARQMPDFGKPLTPQKRLNGQLGLKKNAVVPTVIIKEEDRHRLLSWQVQTGITIHLWHAFYDAAWGITLNKIENLIDTGQIEPYRQVFQSPSGSTSTKIIYKIYYQHAYLLGEATQPPQLQATSITDKNGHILPYVKFVGGQMVLDTEALAVLGRI